MTRGPMQPHWLYRLKAGPGSRELLLPKASGSFAILYSAENMIFLSYSKQAIPISTYCRSPILDLNIENQPELKL